MRICEAEIPHFRYMALNEAGDELEGEIAADSWEDAVSKIGALGHVPITATEIAAGAGGATDVPAAKGARAASANPDRVARWTDQLATLLEADIPLDEALAIVGTATGRAKKPPEFHNAIVEDLRGGRLPSEAMSRQSATFPPFYVGLVRAGEASGALASVLRQLAELLGRSAEAKARIRSALGYPVFLILVSLASVGMVLGVVVPSLEPLFASAGDALPASTRFVIAASNLLTEHGWTILAGIAGAAFLTWALLRSKTMKAPLDRLTLATPLLGPVIRKSEAARVLRTLGMLLRNGVPSLAALQTARGVASNAVFRSEIERITEIVRSGGSLAGELAKGDAFPESGARMALVGERSGRLDEMLLKAGDVLEREATRDSERLIAMISPALTIILGLMIGGVALSLVTAILSVNSAVY